MDYRPKKASVVRILGIHPESTMKVLGAQVRWGVERGKERKRERPII